LIVEPKHIALITNIKDLCLNVTLRFYSRGTDQITAQLITAGGRTIRSRFRKLINSMRNKEQLSEQCQVSIIVPIYGTGNKGL